MGLWFTAAEWSADRSNERRERFHAGGRAFPAPARGWSADRASVSEWTSGFDRSRPASASARWLAASSRAIGVGLAQAHDSQAGAIAHLGMRLAFEDRADHLRGGLAHGFGPVNQPRRRPLQMRLMALGHVLLNRGVPVSRGAAQMRGDALAEWKISTVRGGEARFQLLAGKLVGNAVVMTVDLDVIIDVGADRFPVGDHIAFGGQRLQSGPVHCGEQRGARAFPFAEGPVVEPFEQLADGLDSVPPARRTCGAAAPPISSAPRAERHFRLWLCLSVYRAAPA